MTTRRRERADRVRSSTPDRRPSNAAAARCGQHEKAAKASSTCSVSSPHSQIEWVTSVANTHPVRRGPATRGPRLRASFSSEPWGRSAPYRTRRPCNHGHGRSVFISHPGSHGLSWPLPGGKRGWAPRPVRGGPLPTTRTAAHQVRRRRFPASPPWGPGPRYPCVSRLLVRRDGPERHPYELIRDLGSLGDDMCKRSAPMVPRAHDPQWWPIARLRGFSTPDGPGHGRALCSPAGRSLLPASSIQPRAEQEPHGARQRLPPRLTRLVGATHDTRDQHRRYLQVMGRHRVWRQGQPGRRLPGGGSPRFFAALHPELFNIPDAGAPIDVHAGDRSSLLGAAPPPTAT